MRVFQQAATERDTPPAARRCRDPLADPSVRSRTHAISPRRLPPPLAVARRSMWPSPSIDRTGTREDVFRGSTGGPPVPLSTLHPRCRQRRRMTRGQRGSLLLHCGALSIPDSPPVYPGASRQASPLLRCACPLCSTYCFEYASLIKWGSSSGARLVLTGLSRTSPRHAVRKAG